MAEVGQGHTVNMSSGGIAFSLDRELAPGAFVELSISWPVTLDTGTPMRLVVFGRVVRTMDGIAACSVDKYEFRTQARPTAQNGAGLRNGTDSASKRLANAIPPREPLKGGYLSSWTMSSYRG